MLLEDNIYTLKEDIQQCIVSKMNLDSNYRLFLFDKDVMEMADSFACFENLEIFPDKENMKLKGEIAKDLIIPDKEMEKIKKIVWEKNLYNMIQQAKESNKSEMQKQNERIIAEMKLSKMLDNAEERVVNFKEPKEYQRKLLKSIQNILKKSGLNLDYEEHKEMLILCGNFNYLKFTKNELRTLCNLVQNVDYFLIAPSYSEDEDYNEITLISDDNSESIIIVIGIDLVKED